jgi:predicted ATPase
MVKPHVRNLHALRRLSLPLDGVSALTGANGAGKTTVLLALKVLRAALERGLPEAVSTTLGGSYDLRNHDAPPDEPIELGLDAGDLAWRLELIPRGATVDHQTVESLTLGADRIFARDSAGSFVYRGVQERLNGVASERLGLGLGWVTDAHPGDQDAARMAALVQDIHVFYDADLRGLRWNGSRATEDRSLRSDARNVFTILRTWRDRREDRHRFAFVDEGLRAAFPGVYKDLDFDAAPTTVTARIYRPGDETPCTINHEANGVLGMLVLLSEVASAHRGGIVAIDEPENSLHPFAVRSFVRDARAWARRYDLTVLLTTHSPVVLDQWNGEPERVFALERGRETLPVRLDELRDRAWLAHYTLGDLYAGGDFSANESP